VYVWSTIAVAERKGPATVEPVSDIIPEDRPIKWAWGNWKKGKSEAKLDAYKNAMTYADAINRGMRDAVESSRAPRWCERMHDDISREAVVASIGTRVSDHVQCKTVQEVYMLRYIGRGDVYISTTI
jgi:hypothetical protein